MKKKEFPEKTKQNLRRIMRNRDLAKFGDSLVNFIYSLAKTKVYDKPVGERVYDKALLEAVRETGLRALMQSSSTAGEVGDGAEALIGHSYLSGLFTIDELVTILESSIQEYDQEAFEKRSKEREIMTNAFVKLMLEIIKRIEEII
ncbi:MAG: hypothetical protein KGD59_13785 [Candidatus Heimdallarchaeota archaeon]|nr:hypothetical protein [Candidatus Heimdallarchaeota archaeon]MBY8995616.1 hypothetical protein [Candidatus Heimdallarchaeota archaeon]